MPEAPARTLEYDDYKKCSLISVRDFEAYLERAKQLDLFNKQHSVKTDNPAWGIVKKKAKNIADICEGSHSALERGRSSREQGKK